MFCIGKGSNGKIFTQSNASEWVVKKIKCCLCNKIYREIFFSKHLQNLNIIQSKKIEYLNDCIMITYPKKCMDLQNFLYQFYKKHTNLPISTSHNFIKQILLNVLYMHEMESCHKDLKLDNFLIGEYTENFSDLENQILDSKFPAIYLTDFGCAKINVSNSKESKECLFSGPACSLILQSPEMLEYDKKKSYDAFKVDVWSLGCIFFAICKGYYPFQGNNTKEVLQSIETFELQNYFENTSNILEEKIKNIIEKCFQKNFLKRANVQDLYNYFFEKQESKENYNPFFLDNNVKLFQIKINLESIKGNVKAYIKKCLLILLQKKKIDNEKIFWLCCLFIQKSKQIFKDEYDSGNSLVACISLALDLCMEKWYEVEQIMDASNFYFSKLNIVKILQLKRKIILL